MSKKHKIWLSILIAIMILDLVLHFTIYMDGLIGTHLNYIASVLMAFTLGLEIADIPRLRG